MSGANIWNIKILPPIYNIQDTNMDEIPEKNTHGYVWNGYTPYVHFQNMEWCQYFINPGQSSHIDNMII